MESCVFGQVQCLRQDFLKIPLNESVAEIEINGDLHRAVRSSGAAVFIGVMLNGDGSTPVIGGPAAGGAVLKLIDDVIVRALGVNEATRTCQCETAQGGLQPFLETHMTHIWCGCYRV